MVNELGCCKILLRAANLVGLLGICIQKNGYGRNRMWGCGSD